MDMNINPENPLQLDDIETFCWNRMEAACLDYKDVLHCPIVGNRNQWGVNMRSVVLRKLKMAEKQLWFHTDIRSGKWAELQSDPAISWLFYSSEERLQLRVMGTVSLHYQNEITEAAWQSTSVNGRRTYLCNPGPSSIIAEPSSGLSPALEDRNPTVEESEAGKEWFAIVATEVQYLEWLWLHSKGHRRAAFHYEKGILTASNWLIP